MLASCVTSLILCLWHNLKTKSLPSILSHTFITVVNTPVRPLAVMTFVYCSLSREEKWRSNWVLMSLLSLKQQGWAVKRKQAKGREEYLMRYLSWNTMQVFYWTNGKETLPFSAVSSAAFPWRKQVLSRCKCGCCTCIVKDALSFCIHVQQVVSQGTGWSPHSSIAFQYKHSHTQRGEGKGVSTDVGLHH